MGRTILLHGGHTKIPNPQMGLWESCRVTDQQTDRKKICRHMTYIYPGSSISFHGDILNQGNNSSDIFLKRRVLSPPKRKQTENCIPYCESETNWEAKVERAGFILRAHVPKWLKFISLYELSQNFWIPCGYSAKRKKNYFKVSWRVQDTWLFVYRNAFWNAFLECFHFCRHQSLTP